MHGCFDIQDSLQDMVCILIVCLNLKILNSFLFSILNSFLFSKNGICTQSSFSSS